MVVEVATLIVAIIGAILNGAPVIGSLWRKLKTLFGSRKFWDSLPGFKTSETKIVSERQLRISNQSTIEAALRPILLQDHLIRREAEQFYVSGSGAMSSHTTPDQWSCWDQQDEAGWDV